MPGYVYRVKVLVNLYLWYILNEGLELRVQCMLCFILMQKAILLGETGASCNKNNIFQDCGRIS